MEFPFGHHHSHTHHRRNDDGDDPERRQFYPPSNTTPPPPFSRENEFDQFPPPPPPAYFQEPSFAPPPPFQETQVYHTSHNQELNSDYPPPPTQVTHVSHQRFDLDPETENSNSFRPHLPTFVQHHTHQSNLDFSNRPTYKVYCKADPNFHLTIRDGSVVLAPSDPSDQFQNWFKDEKYSTRVRDEEGHPCFALVNKASGEVMKHSIGDTQPVQLIPYNPDVLDQSILWSESKDLGDGYRTVRMINNIRLNVDAFHGDKNSGGVRNGTTIVLWKWNKGDNQRWRIIPQ
ncbi:ricin B-like lectin R40G3 [Mercurialis annua]|uniref:ricin B-like lectin R40G3 n=1 Tax=Mercurialis annua TaxID=3986 RepID=UPI00215DE2DF|nr:ricin B-like lectin R40G3 [Mercurialis annua]